MADDDIDAASGKAKRTVKVETLRQMGFSEALISEAHRQEERGLHDIDPPPDLQQRIMSRIMPEPGDRMDDGTIYAGISPDTKNLIYAMPADAPLTYTFNEAADYVKQLNAEKYLGYNDWRVPTKYELDVLYKNRDRGELKGTFNVTGSSTSGWYWSSTQASDYSLWDQRFSDGYQKWRNPLYAMSLRCVRG